MFQTSVVLTLSIAGTAISMILADAGLIGLTKFLILCGICVGLSVWAVESRQSARNFRDMQARSKLKECEGCSEKTSGD